MGAQFQFSEPKKVPPGDPKGKETGGDRSALSPAVFPQPKTQSWKRSKGNVDRSKFYQIEKPQREGKDKYKRLIPPPLFPSF